MAGIVKALVGALIAGLGTLATALLDNSVAPIEWVGIASTTLIALYGVWQVPNSIPPTPPVAQAPVRKVGGYTGSDQ